MTITDDPVYLEVSEALNEFRKSVIEKIERDTQERKACKLKNAIDSKLAHELKLNAELTAQLAELSRRGDGLNDLCVKFETGLSISDSDSSRLDNAKDMLEIGKKLTGVRFDFSAPPNVVRGYIKSELNRTLSPFELEGEGASERLWAAIQEACCSGDKENQIPNKLPKIPLKKNDSTLKKPIPLNKTDSF